MHQKRFWRHVTFNAFVQDSSFSRDVSQNFLLDLPQLGRTKNIGRALGRFLPPASVHDGKDLRLLPWKELI